MATGRKKKRRQSMADPVAYYDTVMQVPMLQELSKDTCTDVCNILIQISKAFVLKPDEVLYRLGAQDANTGALIVKGSMRVEREQGDPIMIHAPELIGEMQQLDDYGRRCSRRRRPHWGVGVSRWCVL